MESGGYLFTKILFPDYDVLVPFACACCGTCCERYIPHFLPEEILRIARDKRWPPETTLERYLECYEAKLHGHAGPCPFLGAEHLCAIHDHRMRPGVCRLYPFSFMGGDERCPSFGNHRRIVGALTEGTGGFELYDSSFCPCDELRPVPDERWPAILGRFLAADPPPEVIEPFLALNGLSGGKEERTAAEAEIRA